MDNCAARYQGGGASGGGDRDKVTKEKFSEIPSFLESLLFLDSWSRWHFSLASCFQL